MIAAISFYSILLSILFIVIIVTYYSSSGILEALYNNKGFLILYLFFVVTSLFYFDLNSLKIKDVWADRFGLVKDYGIKNSYTLITSNFIHADISHLLSNMMLLAFVASLEKKYGYIFFIIMFIVPSVAASMVVSQFIPDNTVMLGSSIGLFSLFSIYFAEYSLMETLPVELDTGSKIMDFLYTLGVCAVLMFFCSFGRRIGDSNIYTFFAHLSGCVAGYLFYMALKHLLPDLYDDLVKIGTA